MKRGAGGGMSSRSIAPNSETTPGPGGRLRPVQGGLSGVSLGFPLQLSKNDNKNSIQSALNTVFPFPSLNRSPRPALRRLPLPVAVPVLRLCCCYDPAPRPCVIWSRNAERGPALPLFPIAFYVFSLAPGLVWYNQTRIDDRRRRDAPI